MSGKTPTNYREMNFHLATNVFAKYLTLAIANPYYQMPFFSVRRDIGDMKLQTLNIHTSWALTQGHFTKLGLVDYDLEEGKNFNSLERESVKKINKYAAA